MRNVWIAMIMELKGMRIYATQLLIMMVFLPFSYAVVVLLGGATDNVAFVFSGLVVASLIGVFCNVVAMRVSNLMQPQVLELYAVLPVHLSQAVLGIVGAYTLLVLPQIAFFFGVAAWRVIEPNLALSFLGMFLALLAMAAFGCFLGILVRNPFKAQGVFPLVTWLMLLTAPIYFATNNLPRLVVMLMLLNPATHAVNVLRPHLGFAAIIDIRLSLLVVLVMAVILGWHSLRVLKDVRMIERLF